jgi:hypothetical protein
MARTSVLGDVEIVGTTGEYDAERLYILETLRRLEKKNDQQIEDAGAAKQGAAKMRADLNEAHSRIKTLLTVKDQIERRVLKVETKAAYIAVGSGTLVAGIFEVGKYFFSK